MENKEIIKKRIIRIFDVENRSINIREITTILKDRFKITKSQPVIKKYLEELITEGKLELK